MASAARLTQRGTRANGLAQSHRTLKQRPSPRENHEANDTAEADAQADQADAEHQQTDARRYAEHQANRGTPRRRLI